MVRFIAFLFLLMIGQQIRSQVHTISGFVEDSNSGERIIGAYVIDSKTKSITQTNNYGYYNLKIAGSVAEIQASYIGSKSEIIKLHLEHDTLINIQLQQVRELNEVVIISSIYKHNVNSMLGIATIPVKQLTSIPALGEPDLLKSIQNQPGIKGGVEGSAGIFVRGGGSGENLFMLDDVPMYNVSHLYGFFSAFNSSAIKDIKLYKGCFPARYGGRVSSVIDVRSLDGNNKTIKGEASIGIISSKFTIDGPLPGKKTTFMISGRRSYFDLYSGLLKSLDLMDLNFPGYYFYDLNSRISHTFSQSDKLFLNFYLGRDEIKYENESSFKSSSNEQYIDFNNETSGWGNLIGSLRWNHTFNNLFVNTTAAFSKYNYYIKNQNNSSMIDSAGNESVNQLYSGSYNSEISDFIIKADFDYSFSNDQKLFFGAGTTFHFFNPGSNVFSMSDPDFNVKIDTSFTEQTLRDNEPFLCVEDELELAQRLKIRSGVRFSGMFAKGRKNINAEPRLSVNYAISPRLAIKSGYARMVQYMHLLSTSGLSMPTDIWIPALKGLQPLKSDQINAGISYYWDKVGMISVEAYRKWLDHTTDFKNGASLLSDLSPWFEKTTQGRGNAKGIEFSFERQEGRLTGSINYTYSKANRKYSDLNNGKTFPFKYDRRNDLNISVNLGISEKWDISVLWVYATGYPVTIPVEKYTPGLNIVARLQHNYIYYYPSLHNYRLSGYHRLDIGVHYKSQKRLGQHIISIDIFNAYNRKNPVSMYYIQNYSFENIYLFPVIPSVTYTFKFSGFRANENSRIN